MTYNVRHFFHVTEARRAELGMEEEGADDNEDEQGKEEDEEQSLHLHDKIAMPPPPLPSDTTKSPVAKIEELDVDTSAWLHVPSASSSRRDEAGSDTEGSVTEDDSDNDDVKEENNDWDHLPQSQTLRFNYGIVDEKVNRLLPDVLVWLIDDPQVAQDDVAVVENTGIKDEAATTAAKMGETDDDMQYDTDLIFKHLLVVSLINLVYCTPESSSSALDVSIWIRPRMPAKIACQLRQNMRSRSWTGSSNSCGTIRHQLYDKYASSFETIMGTITKNGGRIGSIDDPKLTHVLLDKRDISRRRELSSRTSQYVISLKHDQRTDAF